MSTLGEQYDLPSITLTGGCLCLSFSFQIIYFFLTELEVSMFTAELYMSSPAVHQESSRPLRICMPKLSEGNQQIFLSFLQCFAKSEQQSTSCYM